MAKRAAALCGAGVCAAASFAAVWTLLVAFSGCSTSVEPIEIGPRIPPQPAGLARHRMILSSLGEDMIVVVHACEGAEALAVYGVDSSRGLSLLAARNIHWDLMGWDFNTNGRGIDVASLQQAVEQVMEEGRRTHKDLLKEHAKHMQEMEDRARALNEEEAQRLRDRETNPPPPEPK